MSNLARLMDGHPTPGEICAAYRPSVALYRLRNAPPMDETTAELFCAECGSDDLSVEIEHYTGNDPLRDGEYQTRVTCREKDCGESFILEEAR